MSLTLGRTATLAPMNRLAAETSPYLLQHKNNPVDWFPWGSEAFELAARLDKPVLLSIGYSSCHWCHVMAHESFEDKATASVMNDLFVNVKVDREERPDIDGIYMNAVQAMTGRGGWPMTVWLTPDKEPFYAGTYFPNRPLHGMPALSQVMDAVQDAWVNRRTEVQDQGAKMAQAIDQTIPPTDSLPSMDDLERAYFQLATSYDHQHGGLGGAPKFPQEPTIEFLLRVADAAWATEAKSMAFGTLSAMADGGIYDHLGGGFSRYAIDAVWLIPHFEKMLYTNAQLSRLYLRAWQMGGPSSFRQTAIETLEYVLADMTHPDGGWFSAEDADSEGEEGKFYVFPYDEFHSIVTDRSEVVGMALGVTRDGNFEGANHLFAAVPVEQVATHFDLQADDVVDLIVKAKIQLLDARSTRVRPGLDDKVVTAWNGLMLRALAEAGAIVGEDRYLDAARANVRFVQNELIKDGRLMRSWGKGRTIIPAFLDDYASYALGLFTLYMATGEVEWYQLAEQLTKDMVDQFWNDGWFQTAEDAEQLLTRPKDQMDNPSPSGASMATEALLWLNLYTGDGDLADIAQQGIREAGKLVELYPSTVGHLLAVCYSLISGFREVAIVGPDGADLATAVWEKFRPDLVMAIDLNHADADKVPLLEGRSGSETLAYVCEHFACQIPATSVAQLKDQL